MNKNKILIVAATLIVLAALYCVFFNKTKDSHDDLIRVSLPLKNQIVKSPLTVTGEARGTWYFEATFPIKLLDSNGNVLVQSHGQAQGGWMTNEFVPFTAQLNFAAPMTETGSLVLEKDNPSGLPEHDDSIIIPVRFEVQKRDIKLYYYNSSKDQGPGGAQCSRNGLESVVRQIPISITPIQDAINLLIKGQLTKEEKDRGLTTEYPLSGVELTGASLNNGILTLEFKDPQNKTSGGSCRVEVLRLQMEETAKQFSGVKSVRFIPEGIFQP
jgi:hypothetical protein